MKNRIRQVNGINESQEGAIKKIVSECPATIKTVSGKIPEIIIGMPSSSRGYSFNLFPQTEEEITVKIPQGKGSCWYAEEQKYIFYDKRYPSGYRRNFRLEILPERERRKTRFF